MAEDVIFTDTEDVAWATGEDVDFEAESSSIFWSLGPTSATAVPLVVDFTYKRRKRHIESDHRAQSGKLYLYKWGNYERFRVKYEFLSNNNSSIINSWFDTNAELLFFITSGGVTEVNSVKIVGDESPAQKMQRPYAEYFKGVINLEGY